MTTYRIFPATDGPGSGDSDDSPITLGMEFYATSTAWVTHLHYWRPTTATQGTGVLGRVYAVSGTSAVSGTDVTFAPGSSTGWITAALDTPIQLTANARYRVAAYIPSVSHYPGTSGYWTSGAGASGITTGILVAPSNSDATSNQQGCFNYASGLAYPGSTFGGANYWVDVTVTDVDPNASTTGALAGNLPAPLTGALTGTLGGITAGVLAGSLPALTGSIAESTTITGVLAAGAGNAVVGEGIPGVMVPGSHGAGNLPALIGALHSGATGILTATLPALTGALVGGVFDPVTYPLRAGAVTDNVVRYRAGAVT